MSTTRPDATDTATANAEAVHCRGVTKTYDSGGTRTTALRGVDLDVGTGELLMLVGPSGCGKTTLISVIAGILDPDPGHGGCRVLGHDLSAMTDRARTAWRGRHVGFVFQAFNLLPTLTAVENVSVPLLINGASRRDATERSEEALRRVGLGDRFRSLPKQLSGGQQQRVAIARSLVHGPDLIVCDEPTSALDHDTGQRVMALLREVAVGPGRALVIVTHDERIFGFADRIARMDDGRVVETSAE
jgi:putative ABC transport system ATP-binding protein